MKKLLILFILSLSQIILFAQKDVRLHNKGLIQFENGNYKLADSLFTEAIRIKPSGKYFYDRALAHINKGDTCKYCSDMKIVSLGGDLEASNLVKIHCIRCDKKSLNLLIQANNEISLKNFQLADSLLTFSINKNFYFANVYSRSMVRLIQGDTIGSCKDLLSIYNLDEVVKNDYDEICQDTSLILNKNLLNNISIPILYDQIKEADEAYYSNNNEKAIKLYTNILKRKESLDPVDLSNIYSKRALALGYSLDSADKVITEKIRCDFDSAKLVCPDCYKYLEYRYNFYLYNQEYNEANIEYNTLKKLGYKDSRTGVSFSLQYSPGFYSSISTTIGYSEIYRGYKLKYSEFYNDRKKDLNDGFGFYYTVGGLNVDYIPRSNIYGVGLEFLSFNALLYANLFNFMVYFNDKAYFTYKPEIGYGFGLFSISYCYVLKKKEFNEINNHQLKLRLTIPLITKTEYEKLNIKGRK